MSGAGPRAKPEKLSSEGDGEIGSMILGISERLVSAIAPPTGNQTEKTIQSPTVGKRYFPVVQTDYI